MSRAVLVLHNDQIREKAIDWIRRLPQDTRVEFKKPRRTLPQNERMWLMLTSIAEQVDWHGMRLTPDDWKLIFLDALKREVRMCPNIDNNGWVNLGRSSSDLSVSEMGDLMTLIEMFGAKHNVKLFEGRRST